MKSPDSMTTSELLHIASLSAYFVKAALVRSVFANAGCIGMYQDVFGSTVITQYITADFKERRNLEFVDKFYLPKMKEILNEGERRNLGNEMKQLFGAQGYFAVETGSVSRYTFDDIIQMKFPSTEEKNA